jgi:hypothetical protein
MQRRYHLRVKLAGEDIVALDGSDLKQAKRDLIELAVRYVQTFRPAGDTSSESFMVFDDVGRLIFEVPVVTVLRNAAQKV